MTLSTRRAGGTISAEPRFAERALEHRRRRHRRILYAVLAVAVAAGLAWVLWWSPLLSVRSVEVDGVTGAEAEAIIDLAAVRPGTPLARVDADAVAGRVRQRVTVAEASVTRSWPSTIVVHAVPRTPVLVLKNPQGQLEVVDMDGVAYKQVDRQPAGIPLVTATGPAGATDDAVKAALALVTTLPPDLTSKVSRITVSSADLVTFRLGKTTVVWGGAEAGDRKVAIVKALLPSGAKVIDVSAPDTPVTR